MNVKALLKSLLLRRFTTSLLVLQVALTLGLIVNSFILTLDIREKLLKPVGLPLEKLLVIELVPTSLAYKDRDYFRSILDQDLFKLSQLDGVNAVSPQIQVPINEFEMGMSINDIDTPASDQWITEASVYFSTPDVFDTFELTLVDGRELSWDDEITDQTMLDQMLNFDQTSNVRSIVVSESLALSLYPDGSAVGRVTNRGLIVGIVEDFNNTPNLESNEQFFFFGIGPITDSSFRQHYILNVTPDLMDTVRHAAKDTILSVQAERDILSDYTLEEHHSTFFQQDSGLVSLFTLLCVLMLVVSAISSFAHAQFHVTRQKKLIGIRRALGAQKHDVLLYVLSENWLITLAGSLIGVVFIIGFNLLLGEHIDISPPSVALVSFSVLIVLMSGTVATCFPAWRTSLIPPVIATRTV